MFEDRDRDMAPKEIPVTFRCDEKFNDWLCRQVGKTDMNRSEFIRKSATIYATLLDLYPDFESVTEERLRKSEDLVRKILVILENVYSFGGSYELREALRQPGLRKAHQRDCQKLRQQKILLRYVQICR